MRILLIIIIINFISISAFTQNKKSYLRNGNKLYNDSSYNDAEMQYRKSLEKDQDYFNATFNLANAVYKQDRYDEASALFNSLSDDENDQNNKAKVYHNLGNTLFKDNKIEDAIIAYKNALRLNPDDDETRYNLALSTQEKRKQEQDKQEQEQDKQEQEQDKKEQEQEQEQEQDKKEQEQEQEQDQQEKDKKEQDKKEQDKQEEMSKETAEKMLEAIQEQEKDLQEKLQKKKVKGKKQTILKDW